MKSIQNLLTWLAVLCWLVSPVSAQGNLDGPLPPAATLTITAPADGSHFKIKEPVFSFQLPESGDWFPQGAPVSIRVLTTWTAGFVSQLEFLANGKKIGDSVVNFIQAPPPGTPVLHEFLWQDAPPGEHRLTVQTTLADGSVVESAEGRNIRVGPDGPTGGELPVVTVQTGRPYALEGDHLNRGEFILRRSGDLSRDIPVNLTLSGEALRGVDYRLILSPCDYCTAPDQEITGDSVVMAAGQSTVTLGVLATFDGLPPMAEAFLEDVRLEVYTPPVPAIVGAMPPYVAGLPDQATVQVVERRNPNGAEIILIAPEAGAVLPLGVPNLLRAIAVDPLGSIRRVEFVANDRLIGVSEITTEEVDIPGRLRVHSFLWTLADAAQAGPYTLTALAKNTAGSELQAGFVPVTVGGADPTLPVVTLTRGQAPAHERGDLKSRLGGFVLSRRGGVDFAKTLTVFVEVGGTATLGPDYQWILQEGGGISSIDGGSLPFGPFLPVTFPAGAAEVVFNFAASPDELLEGDETVRLQLVESPIRVLGLPDLSDFPAYYEIGEPSAGEVAIKDGNEGQVEGPRLSILQPLNGARVPAGSKVPVVAIGVGREGGITDVVLLVDGKPASESHIVFFRPPGVDEEVRHEFTVQLEPGSHQLVVQDLDDPAVVSPPVTVVAGQAEAEITWIAPREEAEFAAGNTIVLEVQAVDPTGVFFLVDFFDGDVLIGTSEFSCLTCRPAPGAVIPHKFEWRGASVGKHVLTARATRPDGTVVSSLPRQVIVTPDAQPGSFVTRVLPGGFEVGKAFTVILEARPDPSVTVYVVEEQPPYLWPASGPSGIPASLWQIASVSHDGVFDSATGKVKFGPFFDQAPRKLTYELIPTFGTDLARFDGVGVADGKSYPIVGDRELPGSSRHPADRQPADDAMSAAELTAYAAAWKREQAWPTGPNPIPLDYVTRAAVLWKGGEHYIYDPGAGRPPFCWVNEVSAAATDNGSTSRAPLAGLAIRHEEAQPDGSVRVTLRVTPAPRAQAFAVEEQLPATGAVSGITGGGEYTQENRTLRWGPFFAGESPVLSYVRSGATTSSEPKGIVSFDGQNLPIHGHVETPDEPVDRLVAVDLLFDGSQQVSLEAGSLQQGAEYELQVASDLKHWKSVAMFSSGQNVGFARDAGETNSNARFYRAVRVH